MRETCVNIVELDFERPVKDLSEALGTNQI